MFVNPVSQHYHPFAGAPSAPTQQQHRISVPDPDPFQALYDSLSNLTLTPGALSSQPTTMTSEQQQTVPEPINSKNDDDDYDIPIIDNFITPTTTSLFSPTFSSSSSSSSYLPQPFQPPLLGTTTTRTTTAAAAAADLSPIPASILFPPGDNVIFAHSSFFTSSLSRGVDLPTPSHIRADLITRCFSSGRFPTSLPMSMAGTAELIPVPSLKLLIKYGGEDVVSATEGKTLIAIGRLLGGRVPVPEVFGWRRDHNCQGGAGAGAGAAATAAAAGGIAGGGGGVGNGVVASVAVVGERAIYMELPTGGNTLESRWAGLSREERDQVCEEVRGFVREWRRLSQAPGRGVVGSIDNTPLRDEIFRFAQQETNGLTIPPPGPFGNVANFHSYFVATAVALSQNRHHGNPGGGEGKVNYQPHHLFPDNVPLAFTHGALHPRNIVVSDGPNPRVVSIIGWEQAGWYPAYWELCKARLECSRHGGLDEWATRYLPGILNLDGYGLESQGWNGRALVQYWDYFVGLMH